MEVFCGVFVLSICIFEFSVGISVFVIGLSQILSQVTVTTMYKDKDWDVCSMELAGVIIVAS